MTTGISAPRRVRVSVRGAIACALISGAIVAGGCGSSGSSSSKPAICSARKDLENSVKGLTSLNPSSGVSGLEAQLKKVESSAAKLVTEAKGEFSSETHAIKSSVDSLAASAQKLKSSPSAGNIAAVTSDATKVVGSVKAFALATTAKCG